VLKEEKAIDPDVGLRNQRGDLRATGYARLGSQVVSKGWSVHHRGNIEDLLPDDMPFVIFPKDQETMARVKERWEEYGVKGV